MSSSHSLTFCLFSCLSLLPSPLQAAESPLALDQKALSVVYSGQETMHFSVSWSGGVKIGDLRLSLAPASSGSGHVITARVTDYGLFKAIYPVDDTFVTYLSGSLKLPTHYEVQQIERGKTVHRLTTYDQHKLEVIYRKENKPPEVYPMAGSVYNEFAAFFITRVLRMRMDPQQFIPAFVDKKRYLVPIKVFGREDKNSIFGVVNTVKVQPKMAFKGLYDKDGDTIFWLTNDACRVPVEIRSKILIGSLVAELVEYANPACTLRKKTGK
ncbi:DUF3108 domain-containing protein [Candidatus Electronema aureum]